MVSDADAGRLDLKDLLVFGLIAFAGLRVSELLSLEARDFDPGRKMLRVPLFGNRKAVREVPLPDELVLLLVKYMRKNHVFGGKKLFKFTERHARNIVYRLTLTYMGRRVRPQALRHSYVIQVLSRAPEADEVAWLLGYKASKVPRMLHKYLLSK